MENNLRYLLRCQISLLAVLLVAIYVGSAGSLSAEQPTLINMTDNTWLKLEPEDSLRYIPRNKTASDILENQNTPEGRSFSGITIGNGRIYYFGGAHGSYAGNDVEIYDIANNIWIQQYKPEVCAPSDEDCNDLYNGWGVSALTSAGRPYPEHTYQQHAYDPIRQRFVSGLTSGYWTFDSNASQWERLTATIPRASNEIVHHLLYDPTLETVIWILLGAPKQFYKYSYDTAEFTPIGATPEEICFSTLVSVYDSARLKHFLSSSKGTMWWYDAISNNVDQIYGIPGQVQGSGAVAYDPDSQVLLVMAGDGTTNLWIYDQAGIWTKLDTLDGPTLNSDQGGGKYGTLVYDSTHKVFLFLNLLSVGSGGTGGDTELWAYRYKKNSGDTPAVPSPAGLHIDN